MYGHLIEFNVVGGSVSASLVCESNPVAWVFPGQGLVAVTKVGQGEVVALGVSLWWNWIASEMEVGADNPQLLQNLLTKPRQK